VERTLCAVEEETFLTGDAHERESFDCAKDLGLVVSLNSSFSCAHVRCCAGVGVGVGG